MANAQKIDEIIDEKAFQEWERFIATLSVGQTRMAELVVETDKLNKNIGNATSLSNFTKSADSASIALEKLRQEQAKTTIANERAAQAELRTIEVTERKAKKDAEAAIAAEKKAAATIAAAEKAQKAEEAALAATEKAARRKIEVDKIMADGVKDLAKHQEDASLQNVRNLKEEERAQQANAASAVSAQARHREVSEAVKGSTVAVEQQTAAYSQYRRSLEDTIRDTMVLKKELSDAKLELKDTSESYGMSSSKALELNKTVAELSSMLAANNMEIKRMTRENISAKGSMDELENQLNSLRVAYRQLSEEERNTSEGAKDLLAEITKLDAEFKKQKKSIGQAQDDVGNYAAIWDSVPGPINQVLNSLGAIDKETKKVSFASITNGLKDLTRQAWAFVKTPIGAAIAALTVVVSGAKLWYDYNKGLEQATKLTHQLTGETGDAARTIRDRLMATSETFGKDFKAVMLSANGLAKEYGLTFAEATEQINTAFIKGADSSGTLLANIDRYAPQMRAAGLSAEEFTAVLVQNQKEGIFGDKGLASIKEGSLRLREMTDKTRAALGDIGIDVNKMQKDLLSGNITMFDAIQTVSGEMGKFSDNSKEVGAVLTQVFRGAGKEAGLGYLKSLKDINTEQDANLDNLSNIEKAQLLQLNATEELNREYSALFDTTGGGFELLMADLKVITTGWMVSLLKSLRGVYNWFVDIYNESVLFRGVIETIPLVFGVVWDAAKGLFSAIGIGVKGLGSVIKDVLTGNFSDIGESWKKTLTEMEANDKTFTDRLRNRVGTAMTNTRGGRIARLDNYDISGEAGPGNPVTGGQGTVGSAAEDAKRQKAIDKAAKARQALDNRLSALAKARLEEEKRFSDESMRYSDMVVKDELNNFHDRMDNLSEYYEVAKEAIQLQKRIELTELQTLSNEATKLRTEGKIAEYDAVLALIELKEREARDNAVKNAELLDDEVRATTLQLLRDRYAAEADLSVEAMEQRIADEQLVLAQQFGQGLINEREYQEEKLAIQKEASVAYIENEIAQLEQIIALGKDKGVDVRELEKNLAKLQLELSKEVGDQQIDDIERVLEKEKEAAEIRKGLYKDIADASFELFDTLLGNQITNVEKEIEQNNEAKERELEMLDSSTRTKEDKAAQAFIIEQNYASKEEELHRKKVQAERKQAIFNKAQAVLNIGLSTGMAIARAFADWPFPVSAGIAATVGALGAVQLAGVLAQPLPQYYTGTDSSKGGPAHVGERGRELFITPDGKLGITPNRDTIMNLEEGTKIFNSNETKRILQSSGERNGSSYSLDLSKVIDSQNKSSKNIIDALKNRPEQKTILTERGLRYVYSNGRGWSNYLKRNL